jgi:hypothetical protein
MRKNFWALQLRLSTVIRLRKSLNDNFEVGLTYIETTRPAGIMLQRVKKRFPRTLSIRVIKQRCGQAGPFLDLAFVRDDQKRVITIPIYHHILEIRREIVTQLTHSFKAFEFFTYNKPRNMITACLGMEVSKDITPAVYMAHYARWKEYDPQTQAENILEIPDSHWSADLVRSFKECVDRVVIRKKQKAMRLFIKVTAKLVRALFGAAVASLFRKPVPPDASAKPMKIMSMYRMGLRKDQRNDISFFHHSAIPPGNMLVLLRHGHHLPTEAEREWLRQSGVQCISSRDESTTVPGVPNWNPSNHYKNELADFHRLYLKTAFRSLFQHKKNSLWLLDRLWAIGLKRAYWKDFFLANNVRFVVHSAPAEENFLINLALSETGGIATAVERSILFDYCTIIHNPPNHLRFITGPYSLTQIPEPSFSLFTLQSGGLRVNSGQSETEIQGIRQIRGRSRIVIAVFDEVPSDWFFGDSIAEMYRSLAHLARNDPRFSLLIKSKKPQILERLDDVHRELLELCEQRRCLVADHKIPVSAAAANADLVVSAPSSAAFESVLTGTRTIVYNPMRSGSLLFYGNNGLNRRVFEDSETMIAAIRQLPENPNTTIGDCCDIARQIDPFRDGRGAERIGNYLHACLQGFQLGLDRETVLKNANQEYASRWGADRIVAETAYEIE